MPKILAAMFTCILIVLWKRLSLNKQVQENCFSSVYAISTGSCTATSAGIYARYWHRHRNSHAIRWNYKLIYQIDSFEFVSYNRIENWIDEKVWSNFSSIYLCQTKIDCRSDYFQMNNGNMFLSPVEQSKIDYVLPAIPAQIESIE